MEPGVTTRNARLFAAAVAIEQLPQAGSATDSLLGDTTSQIFSPLKTTIVLLQAETASVCLISTSCYADYYPFSNILRKRISELLSLTPESVLVFSSHNHSTVMLTKADQFAGYLPDEEATLADDQLTEFGRELVRKLENAASLLRKKLVSVTSAWALGYERRISYNRKGRRPDGSTYFMREEDRVLLGDDFSGDIDQDAPVVALLDDHKTPICFIVQFTAHPVTSYHPETPVTFGDYAQVACDDLSAAYRDVPVLFLQGCAGDINSKLFLTDMAPADRVKYATKFGHLLGDTYIKATRSLQSSQSQTMSLLWQHVIIPFTPVPSESYLRSELAVVSRFLERVANGDETAISCSGLNASRNMSFKYRERLVLPYRRWLNWALQFHTQHRLEDAPSGVTLRIGAFRIGDVGIVGLPCEPFLGIGRLIRGEKVFPLTIPVGYMNDNVGYMPDSENVGDSDYSSSYYRYTSQFLPYEVPAGDLLAQAGTQMLKVLRCPP